MEITFRSFSHFRVFDLCLSNQFVDLPVSRWGRRVLLLREMPRTILQHRKSRAELAWITQNARSEQMRLSQSAMLRGNWTPAKSLLRRCRHEVVDVSVGVLLCALP